MSVVSRSSLWRPSPFQCHMDDRVVSPLIAVWPNTNWCLFFWDVMQHWLIFTSVSVQPVSHIFSGKIQTFLTACPLKVTSVCSLTMSVTTSRCYVTSQNSEDLIYTAVEAWYHANTSCGFCQITVFLQWNPFKVIYHLRCFATLNFKVMWLRNFLYDLSIMLIHFLFKGISHLIVM